VTSSPATAQRSRLPGSGDHDLYLDWLRGCAALLVFLTHVRGGYFVKWSDLDPASQTHLNFLLFFFTQLGREAIVVFFVLSGYLVGGRACVDWRAGRYSFRDYLIARISRLHTVLIPALILTGLFDYLHGAWSQAGNGLQAFLINLFFLQGIFGPVYGFNVPLWSLAFEWWFYVLFGLGLAAAGRTSRRTTALSVAAIFMIAIVLFLNCPLALLMFPLWLMGVAARFLPGFGRHKAAAVSLAFVVLFVALGASSLRRDLPGDYLVGIATAVLIFCMRGLAPLKIPLFSAGKFLAAFSFSLYALHYPLNYLMQIMWVPRRSSSAGLADWSACAAISLALAAICYLFYWVFERRTPFVRAWLERALLRPS
jgi:peptidoglycan/LPS O-acetylase OafA/YrhL